MKMNKLLLGLSVLVICGRLSAMETKSLSRDFLNAVDAGDKIEVERLINAGVDINMQPGDYKEGALMVAVERGNIDMAEFLVANGAKVNLRNIHNQTALMWASESGYIDIVRFLISKGADKSLVDKHGFTALKLAERNNHGHVVAYLLDHDAHADAIMMLLLTLMKN